MTELIATPRTASPQRMFERASLRTEFQPVADLATGEHLGAEALTRWPDLHLPPAHAFACAAADGRLAELDRLCATEAIDAALHVGLAANFALFVNLEPSVLDLTTVATLLERDSKATFVAELAERSIHANPGELLRCAGLLRDAGWRVAVGVGARPTSLALLSLLAPDVVKLDMAYVHAYPDDEQAMALAAVSAYIEKSGATLLAEGIETHQHLRRALALGATLGQGWYFGFPGALPPRPETVRTTIAARELAPAPGSPWDAIDHETLRVGPKGLLAGLSHGLEARAQRHGASAIVLASFDEVRAFTRATRRRYGELAASAPLVATLAPGMQRSPAPHVRGVDTAGDELLEQLWSVVVVDADGAAALVARSLGDHLPEPERRYAFTLTHDREVALGIARSLLRRVERAA